MTSIDDPSAERRLRELVGEEVRSVVALLERADAQDLALVLSDGSRLEIFADSDLDPWSFSIDGRTFVGSASARS